MIIKLKKSKNSLEKDYSHQIIEIKKLILQAEINLEKIKNKLDDLLGYKKINLTASKNIQKESSAETKIIQGIFNGQQMVADNKKYPIPANYASKSMLVSGDKLKLTILKDGSFVYKQIGPIDRKRLKGELKKQNTGFMVYVSETGDKFKVLPASVTYFKAKSGDRLSILVPENQKSSWATVENIIPEDKSFDKKNNL